VKKIRGPVNFVEMKSPVPAQAKRATASFVPENASTRSGFDLKPRAEQLISQKTVEDPPEITAVTLVRGVPVITDSFAAKLIRPGESLKVYLKAFARNVPMKNIFAIIENRGSYQSITEVRKGSERHLAGYLFLNTSPQETSLMFTGFTLKVWIQDEGGRFSDPAVFPVSFQNHAGMDRPPKGVFDEQNLGPIMIQLTPVS
jgi:hypothetical protein